MTTEHSITPEDRAATIAIRNAMPVGERDLRKAAEQYWAQKAEAPPALPTSDQLQAIIARNAERRRIKAPMYQRPYTVEYDDDRDDDGVGERFAFELVSSQEEPSVAYPGTMARRCVANFTETSTDKATAEGVAFCCNDLAEDDVTALLDLVTQQRKTIDEQTTLLWARDEHIASQSRVLHSAGEGLIEREAEIARQADLLRQCDDRLATHERRNQQIADVKAWLVRHGELLGDAAATELRQIVEADDASHP